MKTYHYRAKKSPTQVEEGYLQADSEEQAVAQVNDLGLVVVQIEERTDAQAAKQPAEHSVNHGKISGHAITRMYKQLGRMIQSGIPILQALKLSAEQTDHPKLRAVMDEIQKKVAEGSPVSQVFAGYPDYFNLFDLSMLEAGELVGHLDDSLGRIAAYRESQEKLMSKIRGSMAYPLFVLAAGFAAIIFMLSFVMPKFSAFFLNLGQDLPLPTKILIYLSQAAEKFWPIMIVAVMTLVWILRESLKSDGNRLAWHRFYLGLPKVGGLIRAAQFARFSKTLSILLASGIPLLRSMQAATPVLSNQVIRKELEACGKDLAGGGSLGESLKRSQEVPTFVVHLIRAGEEAGRLQESLNDIADWYEQELQENAEVLTKLLEPILILIVGSILGLMIIAVLLPIFSMNAAVS